MILPGLAKAPRFACGGFIVSDIALTPLRPSAPQVNFMHGFFLVAIRVHLRFLSSSAVELPAALHRPFRRDALDSSFRFEMPGAVDGAFSQASWPH